MSSSSRQPCGARTRCCSGASTALRCTACSTADLFPQPLLLSNSWLRATIHQAEHLPAFLCCRMQPCKALLCTGSRPSRRCTAVPHARRLHPLRRVPARPRRRAAIPLSCHSLLGAPRPPHHRTDGAGRLRLLGEGMAVRVCVVEGETTWISRARDRRQQQMLILGFLFSCTLPCLSAVPCLPTSLLCRRAGGPSHPGPSSC